MSLSDESTLAPVHGWARWSARGAAGFCAAFALFQFALTMGAPFGMVTWGGSSAVLPTSLRVASCGAAVFLALAAAVMLVRSGDLGRRLPQLPFWWLNALLAVQLALNTVANLASRSPGERLLMGSATSIGLLLCVAALFFRRRPRSSGHRSP